MHLQYSPAALHGRQGEGDHAVEAARPPERGIQGVGSVGRRHHNNTAVPGAKAIHLRQDLVEGLVTLTAARTGRAGATRFAHHIDLVNEDDAGRIVPRLGENIADARGADADKPLDKLRGRRLDQGHTCLTGQGARQKCLARAGRPGQQDTLRHFRAYGLERARVLEELHDLLHLLLGLLDAGDLAKVGPGDGLGDHLPRDLEAQASEQEVTQPDARPDERERVGHEEGGDHELVRVSCFPHMLYRSVDHDVDLVILQLFDQTIGHGRDLKDEALQLPVLARLHHYVLAIAVKVRACHAALFHQL
mmetsp:Transcript_58048/g.149430  ORF Transcript_58048/g.149430 Transcript_58048/m.149430 type:complete len:305 (-) Transcript_58048:648-1562(-)